MAVLSEYLCIRKEMKVIKLDHTIHDIEDLSDDSDFEMQSDNKPLLPHQSNADGEGEHDDQSYEVKIV